MNQNSKKSQARKDALLSRRDLLKGAGVAGIAAAAAGCRSIPPLKKNAHAPLFDQHFARVRSRRVEMENRKQGTTDWLLQRSRVDPETKYRCPWIEGYCSHTSIRAGETLEIFVSTNPASPFSIDIYRMGYYQGLGGRLMLSLGQLPGKVQPEPVVGVGRVRHCKWEPSAQLKIPGDWLSGIYLGKLTAARDGTQSYIIFTVRDERQADFLFQCSDTTWQAYNRWPSQFSLYDDGKDQWYWGPGVQVSFDRPYGKYCQILDAPLSLGSGEFFLWEFPFAYWLEAHHYDVTYISNLDTHHRPETLARAKGFLSVGHDEYYSIEMFHQLQRAIAGGLHVGFFSGNTCCGRLDFRTESGEKYSGPQAPRIQSRIDFFGPRDEAEIRHFPAMARLPHVSPNANELVGARSISPITGGADWTCTLPDHWIFEGTGMAKGEGIPGLVGWEWHGDPAKLPGLEVVSTGSTTNSRPGDGGVYTATIYPGPKKNFVFNASTCWWADGLAAPPGYVRPAVYTRPLGPDIRAQRITANILNRMIAPQ